MSSLRRARVVILAGFLLVALPLASEDRVTFQVRPSAIAAGEGATLSWRAEAGSRVYLSSLGEVEHVGEREVRPGLTQTFSLVVEGPEGISVHTANLEVRGGTRGEFPEIDSFGNPLRVDQPLPLVDLLARLRRVLQDEMRFTVDEARSVSRYVFRTEYTHRRGLLSTNPRYGPQQLAYRVEVELPERAGGPVSYTIKTAIRFRMVLERTWRLSAPDDAHKEQSRRLRDRLKKP